MQVFISYAREDFAVAKRLFDSLRAISEVEPWLDQQSLLPGSDWKEKILEAIDSSRFFILLLSDYSIEKDGFVQKEINEGLQRFDRIPPGRIFLIPARVTPCQPKHKRLRDLHWVDLFDDFEKGVQDIVRALASGAPTSVSLDDYIASLAKLNPNAVRMIESHPKGREILSCIHSLRSNKIFPRNMSIDGEIVHNPIYEGLDALTEPVVIGGTIGSSIRIMPLDLYLIKATDSAGQPVLLQYYSATASAGWKTWLFPHGLGFQRSADDIAQRLELDARDFEVTAGLPRNCVTMSYMPREEYLVSIKPDFGYKHELIIYTFLFCTVQITNPPSRFLEKQFHVSRGKHKRKYRWFYFEELQNDPDVFRKNSDVLKAIHTVYATSLVPVPTSVQETLSF